MDWELRLLFWAACGYGLAGLVYLVGLFVRPRWVRTMATLLLSAGWALTAISLALRIAAAQRLPLSSRYDVLLWFVWWLGIVYLVVEERTRVSLPGLLISIVSCGAISGGLLRIPGSILPLPPQQAIVWFGLHAGALYGAYACLAVAVAIELSSVVYGPLTRWESRIPVERQERYLEFRSYAYRLVLFAFPILSFALVSNAFWRSTVRGHYWAWGQEETWALVTWIVFAAYIHLRTQMRTNRVLTRVFSLVGAGTMVLTFTGVIWLARLLEK